jgi:predicted nucleic acid-binding protein
MIIADASVWIDYFAEKDTRQTTLLAESLQNEDVLVGNLIITEVLQGVRDDKKYQKIKNALCALPYVRLVTKPLAVQAAANYRQLRKQGITIRKTIDSIIGAWCIANDFALLHNDRDFDPMEEYLGLKIVR